MDDLFTTSATEPTTLTVEDIQKAMDLLCPPLYYGTSEFCEKGTIIHADAGDFHPEYIVFHPDDMETMKEKLKGRRLVHIKDEPKEAVLDRIKAQLEKKSLLHFDQPLSWAIGLGWRSPISPIYNPEAS